MLTEAKFNVFWLLNTVNHQKYQPNRLIRSTHNSVKFISSFLIPYFSICIETINSKFPAGNILYDGCKYCFSHTIKCYTSTGSDKSPYWLFKSAIQAIQVSKPQSHFEHNILIYLLFISNKQVNHCNCVITFIVIWSKTFSKLFLEIRPLKYSYIIFAVFVYHSFWWRHDFWSLVFSRKSFQRWALLSATAVI